MSYFYWTSDQCERSAEKDNSQNICFPSFKNNLSYGNANYGELVNIQMILYFIMYLMVHGVKVYFYFSGKKQEEKYQKSVNSPEQYSILVKGLPKKATKKDILDAFNKYCSKFSSSETEGSSEEISVERVNIIYKSAEFCSLICKKTKVKNQISKEKTKESSK